MSNNLNITIEGKTVVLSAEYFPGRTEAQRKFKCEDGFGCYPFTSGQAIFGIFMESGEKARVEGFMVEKLAKE